MELTRRSFLAGIGAVSVGLLFRRQLDAVLDSLEQDLIAEQQTVDQLPSAADIVVLPAYVFRPDRLVVSQQSSSDFIIEDIRIGGVSQFVAGSGGIPADVFAPGFSVEPLLMRLDAAAPGTEIRFRVRYVGKDPRGARFTAALFGTSVDGNDRRMVLPIDSGVEIVA